MRTVRLFIVQWSLVLCALCGCIANAHAQAGAPYVGHYRATSGPLYFHLQVLSDGRVEFLSAQDGSRQVLAPMFYTSDLVMGTASSGEVWSVGRSAGVLMISVGTQLFALTPVSPQAYEGAAAAAVPPAPAPGTAGGPMSLGGLALSTASSGGGSFDSREYHFCSDGSFSFTKSFLVSGGGGGETRLAGQWQLQGGQLHLRYREGGGRSFGVRFSGGEVVELDGVGYVAERSRRCR